MYKYKNLSHGQARVVAREVFLGFIFKTHANCLQIENVANFENEKKTKNKLKLKIQKNKFKWKTLRMEKYTENKLP